MRSAIVFSMLGLSLLGGCATVSVAFDPAEVAWSKMPGKNTIEGSAALRTRGGEVRTCAGGAAQLIPSSAYADERVRLTYGDNQRGFHSTTTGSFEVLSRPPVADDKYTPTYQASMRNANCDAQGAFSFSSIPDGTWYVTVKVEWEVASQTQGGWLMQKVELKGGETKKLVLVE